MKQNEKLMERVDKLSEKLEERDQKELEKRYQNERAQKLKELRSLDRRAAEKFKDETDLDKLDVAIDLAKDFTSGFPEYEGPDVDDSDNKPKGLVGFKNQETEDWDYLTK